MQQPELNIPIHKGLHLLIYPHSKNARCYFVLDAESYGESKWQLQEGCEYEYDFIDDLGNETGAYFVEFSKNIVIPRRHPSSGTIKTGIYVGTLSLKIIHGTNSYQIEIEIQSIKACYRNDYRKMLSDITEYYTDLVMLQGSHISQKFEVDNNQNSQTLYQKFSFVKSIVDNENVNEAIHKIIQNPVKTWEEALIEKNITNCGKIGRNEMRQIVRRQNRFESNIQHNLSSLPRTLQTRYKRDTTNNPANQFVKFALTQLYSFCQEIGIKKNASTKLKKESYLISNLLLNYLSSEFFKDIHLPKILNLNNPVLQRKEGYREILQAWLIYDLAAKLNWTGGDNVYEAGKKNVATLYEYWIFFKLLDIISSVFNISPKEKEKLVDRDKDNLNLWLKQGKMIMLAGHKKYFGRVLNVRFYYNRVFGHRENIHEAGSWTMPMRPDYTLSLWPGEITESEAEAQDVIVHIHFDAKYRLNNLFLDSEDSDLSSINNDDNPLTTRLSEEKEKEESYDYEIGIYKRADLLKMHAYKDAIRRTSGAYILYPGTEKSQKAGFHEIIPGLGAFCISPSNESDQVLALKHFLIEVRKHMLNRSSQREKMAFQTYNIYKDKPIDYVQEPMPEAVGENRAFQPDETYVLIGYCHPINQDFILNNWMYNVRTGHKKGAMDLCNLIKAQYVLLWNESGWQTFQKINKTGFKVLSEKDLINLGYTPSKLVDIMEKDVCSREEAITKLKFDGFYTICMFNKHGIEKEFKDKIWNTRSFKRAPHCLKLSSLMKYLKYK